MTTPVSGAPGETIVADGAPTQAPARTGRLNELILSQLRGRWYEQNFRGRIFSGGMTLTSINNATFTTATLGATGTPIAGIWNPINSGVNAEMLLAILNVSITAATATGCGGFGWYYSTGNAAQPATGAKGLSGYLGATGKVQNMAGVALTGLTNNLTLLRPSGLFGGLIKNISSVETAVGQNIGQTGSPEEHLGGSIIVPPGGILALLCGTTPVAHSAWAGMLWAEVPPA